MLISSCFNFNQMSSLTHPFKLGSLNLASRLIQGPLAGFSCAPFRKLFYQFTPPAYCVTEMISAHDVIYKHPLNSRYLYRAGEEKILCYQIAGTEPEIMAQAAVRLENIGANLIDINCGCPKAKIRKKGAGSALLEEPKLLLQIVQAVEKAITIPLTIKIRIQGNISDLELAKALEQAGVSALIVHGRRWHDDYEIPSDLEQIAAIKRSINIPVIANGDIADSDSLQKTLLKTDCDAFMISRAGTGKPWLYQALEDGKIPSVDLAKQYILFMQHLQDLALLESEYKAVLQSKSLIRYYFRKQLDATQLQVFYRLNHLAEVEEKLNEFFAF